MTMNFFKKVITFFSVLWNAISWRKNEKKGKQATQSTEEKSVIEENVSNTAMGTETSFVDVPLHSSGALCAEIPAHITPSLVAPNDECRFGAVHGITTYSSGKPNLGVEENTRSSQSFFSEPIDSKSQVPIVSTENVNDVFGMKEVAISANETAEVVVSEDSEKPVNNDADPVSNDKRILEDDSQPISLDDPCSYNYVNANSNSTPQIATLNNGLQESKPLGILKIPPVDHNTQITRNSDHNLNYTAIGDNMHHDDTNIVLGNILQLMEVERNSDHTGPITMVKSVDEESRVVESNSFTTDSSTAMNPVEASVTPAHLLSDKKEHTQESCSEYSTNYMVKSDSLVNFLPESGNVNPLLESGSNPIVGNAQELSGISAGSSNALKIQNEEIDCCIPLLREGCLEEWMCTKKGILQLSGDHHINCSDDIDRSIDFPKKSIKKEVLSELLSDTFSLEEPLLKAHHLEGCILDEPLYGSVISDDPLTFQEILRPMDTAIIDCEAMKIVDGISVHEQLGTNLTAIGKDSTTISQVDQEEPDKMNRCSSFNLNPIDHDDIGGEGNQSTCTNTFSQFKHFQLEEDNEPMGPRTRTDHVTPGIRTMKYNDPSVKRSSTFVSSEVDTDNLFPSVMKNDLTNSAQRVFINANNSSGLVGSWSCSEMGRANEMRGHQDSASFTFLAKQESPIFGIRAKLCNEVPKDESPCPQTDEDLNNFYPFIDCSSFLFRIPEEIRKEASFNPCVGSAPSRRYGFSNSLTVESVEFCEENDGFEKNYANMPRGVPNCIVTVPNISPCLPDECKNTVGLIKLQNLSQHSHQQLPEGVGTFWDTHPGLVCEDQQQNIVDYPVRCAENYETEYVDAMQAHAYENDQTIRPDQSNGYGYVNQYDSQVQVPLLGIPFGGSQQSVFLPREPLAPFIFPLHPMNLPQSESLPSLMSLEIPDENEQQYPNLQIFWGGYSANHVQLEMKKEDGKETSSFGIVRALGGTLENLSSEGIDDDDTDNTITDPYFHMDENTSLHTVRSKADSFSGSLFCESLRSIISHNTENENVFPSFSCSSVQGCCPSVVMQSCGTTLSNDSLPSVIVEETNYSKSLDDDYLATEKFMNDVNTALNESVMDQIQGRVDPHGNLLGRGDGSMPFDADLEDHSESTENETMSRNSLGENISINNSKLTLFDGVLGTGSVARQRNLSQYTTCGNDSSGVTHDYCREVLNSLLENMFIPEVGQNTTQLLNETAIEVDCQEIQGDSLVQADIEHNVIVQNIEIIQGNHVTCLNRDGLKKILEDDKNCDFTGAVDLEMVAQVVLDGTVEYSMEEVADDYMIHDNPVTMPNEEISNRRGRRNKRRRKRSLDAESEVGLDAREVTGVAIGDGSTAPVSRKQFHHVSDMNQINEMPEGFSKPIRDGYEENIVLKPKADGEFRPNGIMKHDSNCEQFPPLEEQPGHQDDDNEPYHGEPGESSATPSNNRRRRNRRKKRKN